MITFKDRTTRLQKCKIQNRSNFNYLKKRLKMAKKMVPDNVRNINILFIVLLANVLTGCISDIVSTKPMASFEFDPIINIKTGDTITFTNTSKNANFYHWDFGDSCYTKEKNPKHAFKNKKTYLVKLCVAKQTEIDSNYVQETDSLCKNVNVSIGVPVSCFDYKRTSNHTVVFTNCSIRATDYLWDFGDGSTSTEKSPTHTFSTYGTFKVLLTTLNDGISDTISKTIDVTDVINLEIQLKEMYHQTFLDVDMDGIIDFSLYIIASNSPISGIHYYATRINVYNNFEVFSDNSITTKINYTHYPDSTITKSTIAIPKKFNLGDQILNSYNTINGSIAFCCSSFTGRWDLTWYFYNDWIKDEMRYVGFRRTVGNITKIGWIKLKVLDYYKAILYGYKIPAEGNILIIRE